MAAGWNTKLIVESWPRGELRATSVGLAIAARTIGARHVCIVPDEWSRAEYAKGIDFLLLDCKVGKEFMSMVLRMAMQNVSPRGAVLACKNAWESDDVVLGFKWHAVLATHTRLVRSVLLPIGKGLDIAYIGTTTPTNNNSRWIKHVDQRSGEEHFFRLSKN
ncbi:S-adenosyl-L-methionine-dependent methyltransferase [Senna tora]|uniref:S-adenosyl-L-methionine-dependent methyltransferase n=1 Tax=Senna tora TaxID=362788 RepID=A0A834WQQ2_9FABA|nr:S-adenosyl-L-methionine-dependent methyltransferase [Senna tora]